MKAEEARTISKKSAPDPVRPPDAYFDAIRQAAEAGLSFVDLNHFMANGVPELSKGQLAWMEDAGYNVQRTTIDHSLTPNKVISTLITW